MDSSSLNDKQRQAVTAPLGPVLVLAGAGSGKTRVLTYRIAYLIEHGLVAPEHILALTFTNKAAKEMQGRVQLLLNAELKVESRKDKVVRGMPTLGTFHSVCARILRREIAVLGYSSSFTIFDTDDQLKILREICEGIGLGKQFPPTMFRSYISNAKNMLQTPGQLELGLDKAFAETVQQVYIRYQNYLYQQNGLDFDDLLMLTIKIFQSHPKTLQKYQNLFSYILVDEYQDTNHAQYLLLYLVASHKNLFVVGDDAQSIYGFRGSNIANILSFEKDYLGCLVITLEQNYRSTKNILAVAGHVIALNTEQKPKQLWTDNDHGPKIWVECASNERAEAEFVAKKIVAISTGKEEEPQYDYDNDDNNPLNPPPYQGGEGEVKTFSILDQFLKKQTSGGFKSATGFIRVPQLPRVHDSLDQFAVLYRTHSQSRALEEVFLAAGIPYQIVGGLKFYARKEIKDMLAYIRLTVNYADLVSLKRVINEPARGIGDKSYGLIKDFILQNQESRIENEESRIKNKEANREHKMPLASFRQQLEHIQLPAKQHAAVQQFFWLIEEFSLFGEKENLLSLMQLIFKKTGMESWLDDGTDMGQMRIENVKELYTVAAKFSHLPWHEAALQFLEEVSLVAEIDTMADNKDAVTMMTLHSAKGLEFDTVFFVGLEEGILPHSRTLLDPSEIAEEIRLAYVGITRARRQLYLLYAEQRSLFGNTKLASPSRILKALPGQHITGSGALDLAHHDSGELTYEAID